MTVIPEFSSAPQLEKISAIKAAFDSLPEEDQVEIKRAGRQIAKQVPDIGDAYAMEILASIGALMIKLGEEESG